MPTFDLAEVRDFAARLDARIARCDNGEGLECANLDASLKSYANMCVDYCEHVRQWGRAVFSGHAAFDPQVEQLLLEQGSRLHARASVLLAYGRQLEGICFVLEAGAGLGSAVLWLERLLTGWVTPRLATAPAARLGVSRNPADRQRAQQRIQELVPLSEEWQPSDPGLQAFARMLREKPKR